MKHLGRLLVCVIMTVNTLFVVLLLVAAYSPWLSPVHYPMLSLFGLTFPLFLLINLLFLLFWLIVQQYKAALLPFLALLMCGGQIQRYMPLHLFGKEPTKNSFKLLSYNVMGFDEGKKENGRNAILTYLQESDADIICLQEYAVQSGGKRVTQADVNAALKKYKYCKINSVGTGKHGYNNRLACFSKYPLLSAKPVSCKSHYNGAVAYEVKIGNDTLTLVNCHLESNKLTMEDKTAYVDMLKSPETEKVKSGTRLLLKKLAEAAAIRAPQADSVLAVIEKMRHPSVIVCGDFNDTPISYVCRRMGESLNDAFTETGNGPGISYNRNFFLCRIDHILTSGNLEAYRCTVDRSIKASDHYPICCYIDKTNEIN